MTQACRNPSCQRVTFGTQCGDTYCQTCYATGCDVPIAVNVVIEVTPLELARDRYLEAGHLLSCLQDAKDRVWKSWTSTEEAASRMNRIEDLYQRGRARLERRYLRLQSEYKAHGYHAALATDDSARHMTEED